MLYLDYSAQKRNPRSLRRSATGKKKLSTPCWKAKNLLYLLKRLRRCRALAGAVPVVGRNTKRRSTRSFIFHPESRVL